MGNTANTLQPKKETKQKQNVVKTPKPECDRCGGDHISEECPYYSKEKDPEPGYDKDGNKLQWAIEQDRKTKQKEFWKRATNIMRMSFAAIGLLLLSIYLLLAASGCGDIGRIMNTEEYEMCVLDNSKELSTASPSSGELIFVIVIGVLLCLLCILEFVARFCSVCFGNCCMELQQKYLIKFMVGIALLFLFAAFIVMVIMVHVFVYFNEVNNTFSNCVEEIPKWNKTFKLIKDSFIMQWFALGCVVSAIVSHVCYSKNDAIII